VPESHTTSTADELADFSRLSLHQPLDEWQHNSLRIGCGEQPDGTWSAQEVALLVQRQQGKGGVFEARGLGGLFLLGERKLIYTAHVGDTAKSTFERCVALVEGSDDLMRRVKRVNRGTNEEAIEHIGGGILEFKTRGTRPGKGRGLSCDTLFLDEALYLQQELLDGLLPTMLARANPQIWYMSTPPESPEAPLMKIRDDGLDGVAGMAMAMWANEEGADLEDDAVLAFANPAWGIRLNRGVMNLLLRRLGPAGFARECGGIWPPRPAEHGRWLLFPEALWNAAKVDPKQWGSKMRNPVAIGVAVSPDRDWSAIVAAGPRAGGGRLIEVTGDGTSHDYRPGTGWLIGRLQQLEKHEPCVVVIGDKAIADQAQAAGLVVIRAQPADEAAGGAILFDGIAGDDPTGRDVHHTNQGELRVSASAATKRGGVSGASWMLQGSGTTDITPLRAAGLALWGLATPRIHRPPQKAAPRVW
jgi:hypothetical protein